MYNEYFGFTENPFKITPDPEYIYLSLKHEEAIELIEYGIRNRKGFMSLVGEVGTGKSTIVRYLVRKLPDLYISLILNPFLAPEELLYSIARDFGIDVSMCFNTGDIYSEMSKFLVDCYKNGKNAVVIIDEAQNLSFESFEMVRQLSNIELENDKLLQILLVGQPELEDVLVKENLRQLNQRISIRAKLTNFDQDDTENYINHRISIAAGVRKYIFDKSSIKKIYKYTKGNPREINQLCDLSLIIAMGDRKKRVDGSILDRAAKNYYLKKSKDGTNLTKIRYKSITAILFFFIMAVGVVFFLFPDLNFNSANQSKVNLISINKNIMDNKSNGKPKQDNFTDNNSKSDSKNNELDNNSNKLDNNSSILPIIVNQVAVSKEITKDNQSNIKSNGSNGKNDTVCLYVKKNINLREAPSFKSKVDLILIKNKKYVIDKYEYRGEWVYINFKEVHGYLYNSENLFILKGCKEDE
ncbi:ExeA family protein [Calditerrivibrio nitroreducens]|uniref:ExeA family protein n=1 Tax=Calditerrivibrio nitroreducens TaxID=477976 RepID=UPI003C712036